VASLGIGFSVESSGVPVNDGYQGPGTFRGKVSTA